MPVGECETQNKNTLGLQLCYRRGSVLSHGRVALYLLLLLSDSAWCRLEPLFTDTVSTSIYNRPVACKQWNFNEILITPDVTTGCCGCWRKCMESIGETSGSAHKASTGRKSIPYVLVLQDWCKTSDSGTSVELRMKLPRGVVAEIEAVLLVGLVKWTLYKKWDFALVTFQALS